MPLPEWMVAGWPQAAFAILWLLLVPALQSAAAGARLQGGRP